MNNRPSYIGMHFRSVFAIALLLITLGGCTKPKSDTSSVQRVPVSPRALAIAAERERIAARIEAAGGVDAAMLRLITFRAQLGNRVAANKTHYFDGYDGHLFSKDSIFYLLDENLTIMPGLNGPHSPIDIVSDLHHQLKSKGIDLIYIPIPSRAEVFPDKLTKMAPSNLWVSPQLDIFLLALMDAGVETLDLRADYLEARDSVKEPFYPLTDSHWGGDAIQIAARKLSDRLTRYDFAKEASQQPKLFEANSVTVQRAGSFVRVLPDEERAQYPPDNEVVYRITDSTGNSYRDVPDSPVVIVGDSFVMRNTDMGGSLSANLAQELNLGVTTLSSAGGGTRVPRALAMRGPNFLEGRRVVLWVMVSRYLGDIHGKEWATAELP